MTDAPTDWEGLVEFRARALCQANGQDPDEMVSDLVAAPSGHGMRFSEIAAWKKQIKPARATLIAEYEAGIRHVPAEATEEMVKAFQRTAGRGKDCDDAINAAIAAGAIKPEEE